MRAWGLPESTLYGLDVSAILLEDARKVKRTTNWPAKLPLRAQFIEGLRENKRDGEGEQVFFAAPLCIGFGQAHARQTIEAIWNAGAAVYVHTLGALYVAGDDITDLLAHVEREASTARVRKSRASKAGV